MEDLVVQWFAMRATYRRELLAKQQMEQHGIKCFIPMQYKFLVVAGKRKRMLVPAVHSLIFVQTDKATIQEFKRTRSYLQYMTSVSADGTRVPVIVPDRQMEAFIRIASTCDEGLMYIEGGQANLAKGTRVRIVEGPFAGAEGVLAKVAGVRDKRVIVSLEGLVSIAAAHVPPEHLEVVLNK